MAGWPAEDALRLVAYGSDHVRSVSAARGMIKHMLSKSGRSQKA